jgi:hypothetical protein
MPYFNEYFKSIAVGDISSDFNESNFSGMPFRIKSGEKILCTNTNTKEYHWFEKTVILHDHYDNKYVFDLTSYRRLLYGSSRKLISFDDIKFILNADVIKEDQAARVIQKAFKKRLQQRRSAIVIQRTVLEYIYRPGGRLFNKRKCNFESLAHK